MQAMACTATGEAAIVVTNPGAALAASGVLNARPRRLTAASGRANGIG